jgi:hypothetical protein
VRKSLKGRTVSDLVKVQVAEPEAGAARPTKIL